MRASGAVNLGQVFEADRHFLWGLCYRLTGNAADADDLVQETFVRAMKRPPTRTDMPWRPWLVRVAVNLGRDLLRRRKRRRYPGPWLPSPLETGEQTASSASTPAGHYDLLESVTFAFLLALEALTPTQRAVLLLREVFDYSVRETAKALRISESNVKTTHHRARRVMGEYDRWRRLPTAALQRQTGQALDRLVDCLARRDVAGVEALLAEDVRALSDGGGEFVAARAPVAGRERVARFFLGLSARLAGGARSELRLLNGLPALVTEFPGAPSGWAPRAVLLCELGRDGRIARLLTVLASRKLKAVR